LTGKYTKENGSKVYIENELNTIFNTPVEKSFSLRKHGGYTYPGSADGEVITFPPGWYGDQILACRNANLNGDEFPDLVAQSTSNWQAQPTSPDEDKLNPERRPRVHLMLNDGNGFMTRASELISGNEYFRIHTYKDIFLADLNNDGLDDIMTGSGGGGPLLYETVDDGVLILMSDSQTGSYSDQTDLINFPRVNRDRGDFSEEVLALAGVDLFVAADIDQDGWKDIVTMAVAGGVRGAFPLVLLNQDGQGFEPWDRFKNDDDPIKPNEWTSSRGGRVVDFDNDGDDDVVVLCYTDCWNQQSELYAPERNNGFILINNNGNIFKNEIIHLPQGTLGNVNKNDSLAVGDVNGDGYPDLVISQGKIDPYYIDRDLQILINQNGQSLSDETDQRIVNLRDDYNGHAEGNTYLIDYDKDGDLDIFDFQANVRNGISQWNTNAPNETDQAYPYWKNGGALFLNDGTGNFINFEVDETSTGELPDILEAWQFSTFNEPYFLCPVDFGGDYGYGFGFSGSAGEESSNIDYPDGIMFEDFDANGFALGRKLNDTDDFRED
tara:strand:+ start:127 stop:1782 length:1656 start_codon:yes stop_codon:yes gene_type:complete